MEIVRNITLETPSCYIGWLGSRRSECQYQVNQIVALTEHLKVSHKLTVELFVVMITSIKV